MHTVIVDSARCSNFVIVVGQCPIDCVIVRSQFVCTVLQFAALSLIGIVNILSENLLIN